MYNEKEELAGIALGSDTCSEHEWGTKTLQRLFGLDETKDGIERRLIHALPKDLRWLESKKYAAIFCSPTEDHYKQPEAWIKDRKLHRLGEEPLVCAWDEKTFGIVAYGEDDKKNLKVLWDAFQKMDIAFWTNIGVFHMGGGLIFCIASMASEEDKKIMFDGDLDHKALKKAASDTGIEEELRKANKGWFALSPKWAKDILSTKNGEIKTKYPVVFWLNPRQQDIHNFGWFTVEQLRDWAQNKGIIMKEKRDE